MRTAFETGDMVRANVAEQGMTLGATYIVMDALRQETTWGTVVTYIIMDGNEELRIGNGHMLLTLLAKVTR
jgi:hypothetical protein